MRGIKKYLLGDTVGAVRDLEEALVGYKEAVNKEEIRTFLCLIGLSFGLMRGLELPPVSA